MYCKFINLTVYLKCKRHFLCDILLSVYMFVCLCTDLPTGDIIYLVIKKGRKYPKEDPDFPAQYGYSVTVHEILISSAICLKGFTTALIFNIMEEI